MDASGTLDAVNLGDGATEVHFSSFTHDLPSSLIKFRLFLAPRFNQCRRDGRYTV